MSEEPHPNRDAHRPSPPVGSSGISDPEIASEVSRRVSAILDAVEREAAGLRAETREQADRYLEDSRRRADALVEERRQRIAELSDEILEKAEAVAGRLEQAAPVRAGFDRLVRSLGDAAERLAREAERSAGDFEPSPAEPAESAPETQLPEELRSPQPATAPSPPPATAAAAPGPPAADETTDPSSQPASAEPSGVTDRDLERARLIAIQLAAAGSTRREVSEHLHSALGLAESSATLDEIFGADSGAEARVPWTTAPR